MLFKTSTNKKKMLDYLNYSICPISKPYSNFIILARLGSGAILLDAITSFYSHKFFFLQFLLFNFYYFFCLMVEIESWFFNFQSQSLKAIDDLNLFWCAQVSHRRYMYRKRKRRENQWAGVTVQEAVAVAPFYYHYHRSLCGKLHLLVIPSPSAEKKKVQMVIWDKGSEFLF